MRHVDERDADLLLDRLELDLERLPELRVEGAQRLVEQEDGGIQDQRPREGDPLLLAAGELIRPALLVAGQTDELERATDHLAALPLRRLLVAEAERDVLLDVQMREQRIVLEDRVHVPLVRRHAGHVDAVEDDLPLRGALEPGDHPQRRGLPAARRAEEREELAGSDLQIDAVDRGEVAEAFHEFDQLHLATRHEAASVSRA